MNSIPVNTSYAALVVLAEFESGHKVLLLKRTVEGYWCHVAGKIEAGETAWRTVIRELKEETSIGIDKLYSASYIDRFYDELQNKINLVPVFVTYVAREVVVNLNREHTDYRWCSLEEAKALVEYPNMKELYEFVWRHFVSDRPEFSAIQIQK